jgi:hypothetical protein
MKTCQPQTSLVRVGFSALPQRTVASNCWSDRLFKQRVCCPLDDQALTSAFTARSPQAQEREALRLAGKAKLEQYRKLKASVMNDIENKLSTFTAATPEAIPDGAGSSSEADPMVEMLLEQVSYVSAEAQPADLAAAPLHPCSCAASRCSSL